MKKTYLFDFDGTLVDSMPSFIGLMLRILDEHKIKYDDGIIKVITPLGYGGTAEYFRTLGIKKSTKELVDTMQAYAKEDYTYKIPAKCGVIEGLQAMRERGFSLNILTASPHAALDPCLNRLGIFELFENVWSCDDFGTTKADPKIYEMAAQRLGRGVEEVIFVDDNINAVKTAKSAGMIAYGIYDDSSCDLVDEMKKTADGYVMNFKDLLRE